MRSSARFLFLHVMKTAGTSFVFHLLREPENSQAGTALRARIALDNVFDVEFYEYANELAQ